MVEWRVGYWFYPSLNFTHRFGARSYCHGTSQHQRDLPQCLSRFSFYCLFLFYDMYSCILFVKMHIFRNYKVMFSVCKKMEVNMSHHFVVVQQREVTRATQDGRLLKREAGSPTLGWFHVENTFSLLPWNTKAHVTCLLWKCQGRSGSFQLWQHKNYGD